ncbi:GNAT family N-acetyltransferase [Rhodococcus fascians]|nr:GNAT family N-acetyltransferase [Rhodococcus fascians]MBY3841195.1 GNAT family N-acetyltransferase [Rhodococcus fascians]MBY3847415.1 GNAT family N-acetyltransferase [Rhodococcus fascians]MBY3852711.1 GNAT family N-acetyltransferase [Rhodococcus fascians]MBY3857444.1 GNAT family N-acetyltransferase [Rhodococcus fascians]
MPVDLVVPSDDLAAAWQDAHAEWGPGFHEDGFGLAADDDAVSTQGFSDWVERLRADVECTCRWIAEDERVLGGIALRHDSNKSVGRRGHIGYGVRPSERGRGVATWAVREMLMLAADLGMTRITAVCAVDNAASIATLKRAGGEQVGRLGSVVRFWIPVP